MFSSARIWTASRATRAPKIRSTGVSHSPTQFYGYSTARIRATLARFYNSCPCAFAKSMTPRMAYAALSAAADFLIANGLRFFIRVFTRWRKKRGLQPVRRRYNLASARCKKIAISYFDSHPFRPVPPAYLLAGARDLRSLVACRSSLVTGFLIYRTAIRNPCNALKT